MYSVVLLHKSSYSSNYELLYTRVVVIENYIFLVILHIVYVHDFKYLLLHEHDNLIYNLFVTAK